MSFSWRAYKRQHSQPKTTLTEPTAPELEPTSMYEMIRHHCYRATEAALQAGTEPMLLVAHDVWRAMMEDPIIRADMRYTGPPAYLLPTELCVLYGVHILVARPERSLSVSQFTGETYDPEWGYNTTLYPHKRRST